MVTVGAILALTFAVAAVAPPNNWDAMAYHDARVMEWWDHGDLTYWYTPDYRQLSMPPLASYFKLALLGLTGNDFLFNLVQWSFFLFTIAAAYALAAYLWPEARSAHLAGVLVATLPMAILQSTSTQNDLVVAGYWLVGAFFLLRALDRLPSVSTEGLLLGCAAVGLSWLTKVTSLLYTGPTLVVVLAVALKRVVCLNATARRAWLRTAVLGCSLAVIVNLGHWARNQAWFGSVIGPPTGAVEPAAYLHAGLAGTLRMVASQLLRNAALQLDSLRFVGLSSDRLIVLVASVHHWLGISLNDTALTFSNSPFESIRHQLLIHEDYAGCTWHFLLACVAPVLAITMKRLRTNGRLWIVFTLGWAAWLLLCVGVRWMPWNQRLQLPVLIWLMVPVAGVFGAKPRLARGTSAGVIFLVLAATPALFFNAIRPLISWTFLPVQTREMMAPKWSYGTRSILVTSRWENYFRHQPMTRVAVEEVLRQLPPSCGMRGVVGLKIRQGSWESVLWVADHRAGRHLHFRHTPQGTPPADVCAVIRSDCPRGEAFCLEPTRMEGANE